MNSVLDDIPETRALACVVVTYQPDAAVIENVRLLSQQSVAVFIVDNASRNGAARRVEQAAEAPGVVLIRNDSNLGIGAALNVGIRKARAAGFSWIATFDQDTRIGRDYFLRLFHGLHQCNQAMSVGMIVPGGWTEPGSKPSAASVSEFSFVNGAVNSGSVIRADVLDCVGVYEEALFIDYVDTEFCLRLQRHRFKILSVNSVFLEHELGAKQTRCVLGKEVSFRVHAAWRYYYIMRNRILLYRRYAVRFPKWFLRDGIWMILELGRMAVLETNRVSNLRAAFRGIWDGLTGRTGRHPQFPA